MRNIDSFIKEKIQEQLKEREEFYKTLERLNCPHYQKLVRREIRRMKRVLNRLK